MYVKEFFSESCDKKRKSAAYEDVDKKDRCFLN